MKRPFAQRRPIGPFTQRYKQFGSLSSIWLACENIEKSDGGLTKATDCKGVRRFGDVIQGNLSEQPIEVKKLRVDTKQDIITMKDSDDILEKFEDNLGLFASATQLYSITITDTEIGNQLSVEARRTQPEDLAEEPDSRITVSNIGVVLGEI